MTGTTYGLAEVAEQLFWVSTALQTPTDAPGASLNFAEASATFVVDETVQLGSKGGVTLAEHIGTAHCKVRFKSKFLDQKAQLARGHCWHNLFQHCAIVSGYPIPSRPSQRPGLEVPFDMLAALACAERVTPFCGNLVAKGFSTLLFVTCHEDRCMFWHLVYNKDGSRVSFTDDRVFLPAEMESTAMQLRPDDIDDARHIVGWTARLKKNTGMHAFSQRILTAAIVADFKGHIKASSTQNMTSAGPLSAHPLAVLLLKRFRYAPGSMSPLAALLPVAKEKKLSISRTKMIMWAD